MNQCPECDYLVPSAWDECRRCGASLFSATPVAPVGAPSSTRIARPRPDLSPRSPSARPLPPPINANYSPPPRVVSGPTRRRRGLARIPIVGPVCIMVVAASLWVGWQRINHPPVPAALRPWIEHNQGVVYRPAGTPLSVALPSIPQETNVRVVFGPGLSGSARVARSVVGDHEIMVVWLVAPSQALHPPGGDPATLAADFAGRAGGFRFLVPTKVERLQRPGIEGVVERGGPDIRHDGRALVVFDGNSIYAVVVSAPQDPEAGFDFLVDSFRLGFTS